MDPLLTTALADEVRTFHWTDLPDLMLPIAGQYVGVCDGKLLVLGGTHWTAPPWARGTKIWSDLVQVFDEAEGKWVEVGRLRQPLAYGIAVTVPGGMICIGGQTPDEASARVFRVEFKECELTIHDLPDLPRPTTMPGAALVGNTIYVAGGQASPLISEAMHCFWSLDLDQNYGSPNAWQELEAWSGAPRILPVAVGTEKEFYLISGADLSDDGSGAVQRHILMDAHCFTPGKGWRRIADVPRPCVAAPALHSSSQGVLIFGGDDGMLSVRSAELRDKHPGFNRSVLRYDPDRQIWSATHSLPIGLVTTGAVRWKNRIVIPGGEDRPGSRSARVIVGQELKDEIKVCFPDRAR